MNRRCVAEPGHLGGGGGGGGGERGRGEGEGERYKVRGEADTHHVHFCM